MTDLAVRGWPQKCAGEKKMTKSGSCGHSLRKPWDAARYKPQGPDDKNSLFTSVFLKPGVLLRHRGA